MVYAFAAVAYRYTGIDDRTSDSERIVPIPLGYLTGAGVARLSEEDISAALSQKTGESRAVLRVLGFAQRKPRRERLQVGSFREGTDAKRTDRTARTRGLRARD